MNYIFKKIEIRDPKSAAILKRHVDGAELISPAMREIVKEEKIKDLKNRVITINFLREGFHLIIIQVITFQLAQAIQKLSSNFSQRKGYCFLFSRQLPAYIPPETHVEEEEDHIEREISCSFSEKMAF